MPIPRRSNNLTDAGPRNQTLSDQKRCFHAQRARPGATMAISATTTVEYPGWIKSRCRLVAMLAVSPPIRPGAGATEIEAGLAIAAA
jgi:hypothetical protein